MAKTDVTRTELVWPGKYDEDGTLRETPRVNLPFQVIETVNESRATREARKTVSMPLFDVYAGTEGDTFEEGWKNKLIWGANLLVTGSHLEKFAGKIDLIYIAPPFATGCRLFIYGADWRVERIDVNHLPSHVKLEPDGRPFKTSPRGDYTDESIARLEQKGEYTELPAGESVSNITWSVEGIRSLRND